MTERPARGAASSAGLRLLAQHDLGGHGDGMQVIRAGDVLYVGHLGTSGMGTSILDVADPARPAAAARWWWPGQREDEEPGWPAGRRYAAHHALIAGGRAYLGYDDAGMVVLDVTDITRPRQVAHLGWDGGSTHTCLPLPGRGLVVATDEQVTDGPHAPRRAVRVIDVAGASPAVLAVCPHPDGFAAGPLRFGAHNLHENQPGAYRSERVVFATYFSAGVRVYDLADPHHPVEVAHWVPEPPPGQAAAQINDLFVDAGGLIWVTDRIAGGLYVLQAEPGLAALMEEARLP